VNVVNVVNVVLLLLLLLLLLFTYSLRFENIVISIELVCVVGKLFSTFTCSKCVPNYSVPLSHNTKRFRNMKRTNIQILKLNWVQLHSHFDLQRKS
jgi:hypothetical protein